MRIAFYSDNFYPELSGIVDSILLTGQTLMKHGHDVMFVGPHYPDAAYRAAKCSRSEDQTCIGAPSLRMPSTHLPFSPTGQSRVAIPTGSTFRAVRKFKPDVIHTQSPYGAGLEAVRVARRLNVPLVGTNHTVIEEYFHLTPNIMRRYERWYYNHCAYVSAPYQGLIEHMREAGFRREGGAVPNPVNLSVFCPPETGRGERAVTILYSGRLSDEKRIDVALRAFALLVPRFSTLSFVIAGAGAGRPKLEALVHELNVSEQVRFTGFLPHEELDREFCNADIFIIMSTSDSQSLTLMEAYATGLPAVGARSHGLIDYIPSACGFLVEPGDYRAAAAALEKLISDKELRERMGAAGSTFVAQFSPDNMARRWEEVYQRVIDTHRTTGIAKVSPSHAAKD